MSRSIYIDKLHHVEHDIYVVLKDIFSFLSKGLQPILKGLCFTMAGFGGLVITGYLLFLLLLPVLFIVAVIMTVVGF